MEDPKPATEIPGSLLAQGPSVPFDFCAPNDRLVRHRLFLPKKAEGSDPRRPSGHALRLQRRLAAGVLHSSAIRLGRTYSLRIRIEARLRTPSESSAGIVKNEWPSQRRQAKHRWQSDLKFQDVPP